MYDIFDDLYFGLSLRFIFVSVLIFLFCVGLIFLLIDLFKYRKLKKSEHEKFLDDNEREVL